MDQTIFDLAQKCIQARQEWESGYSVTIWKGKVHKVVVVEGGRDGGGILYLGFYSGRPGEYAFCICGHLGPRGWIFDLDAYSYRVWVKDATKILRGKHNGK